MSGLPLFCARHLASGFLYMIKHIQRYFVATGHKDCSQILCFLNDYAYMFQADISVFSQVICRKLRTLLNISNRKSYKKIICFLIGRFILRITCVKYEIRYQENAKNW